MSKHNEEKFRYNKRISIKTVILILVSIIIPIGIIYAADLFSTDKTIVTFLIVMGIMYTYALKEICPLINTIDELKLAKLEIEESNDINSIKRIINKDKYSVIGKRFEEYYKTLKSKEYITEEGEVKKEYYYTESIENVLDEESLVFKKLKEKTVNHIAQALTGVGIFGTFLGIVKGVSELDVENSEAMKSGIEILLKGVKVSFNTSLYGIMLSIILIFIFKLIIDMVMKRAYEVCDEMNLKVKRYRDESGLNEIKCELENQTALYQKLSTDIAEEMGKRFDESLQINMENLATNLGNLIVELQENFANSINDTNNQTVMALTSTIGPIIEKLDENMNQLKTKQDENTGRFMEESIKAIREVINVGTTGEIERLRESMDIISDKNAELVDTFTTSMENMKSLTMHQENLVKNTSISSESMNTTTESMKILQEDLIGVIASLKNINSENSSSIESMQANIEVIKNTMKHQIEINKDLEVMLSKSHELSFVQDSYINKFNIVTDSMNNGLLNVEAYMKQINNEIENYKNQFNHIKESTITVSNKLDQQYKNIAIDLECASDKLNTSVELINNNLLNKVNTMGNMMNTIVDDLNNTQIKTEKLTEKIESFAAVEKSTQDLWKNYKTSFEELNSNINEGVENYTKHISAGVNNLFREYDSKIADAISQLAKLIEQINDSAEEIVENLEPISNLKEFTNKLR